MYTLLYGFYKYLVQKEEYCVLILGLDNAGKTVSIIISISNRRRTILLQTYLEAAKTKLTKNYKGMHPSKITTTVGLNIGKIDITGVRLNFWDLGGQTELQSLWDKVFTVNCFYQHNLFDFFSVLCRIACNYLHRGFFRS